MEQGTSEMTAQTLGMRMTMGKLPDDEARRKAAAEGSLLLEEAHQRLEVTRLEIATLRIRLAEANTRFEELQKLVTELDQTFGGDRKKH